MKNVGSIIFVRKHFIRKFHGRNYYNNRAPPRTRKFVTYLISIVVHYNSDANSNRYTHAQHKHEKKNIFITTDVTFTFLQTHQSLKLFKR